MSLIKITNISILIKLIIVASVLLMENTLTAIDWPREIVATEGKIIIYQPQPEKLSGNQLTGRSAMSLHLQGKSEPIFGVFWFSAMIDTDLANDLVAVNNIKVTRVRWPDSSDTNEQRFTAIVESAVSGKTLEISRSRLSASLASADVQAESLYEIKNDPPVILFSETLSVLLSYDGTPDFRAIENTTYKRAINTPFMVASDLDEQNFFLTDGGTWFVAKDAMGPWRVDNNPPKDLVKLLPANVRDEQLATKTQSPKPPEIISVSKPTELIVTSGQPEWTSLPGGKILYVKNTETPWLRELSSNLHYVLLSGRWFSAKELSGPWIFVRSDQLPESFAEIPPASEIGGIRTSIAGTEEAEEAIMDYMIPQTTAIKRANASVEVKYDGEPEFKQIPKTSVMYAVNTASQVLRIDNMFYVVENAVWYVASTPKGPWQVADKVPTEKISEIPSNSPVYNTRYVHVYHSTPEVVYVGYLPGYMWSFPYYGVPVYGTGWYYPSYYGSYYYPRPATWGMHVGYNSVTGWNYGMTWSNGFITVGFHWGAAYNPYCCYGWYGGYRGPVVVNRPVIINPGNINIGNNINVGNRENIAGRLDGRQGISRDFNNNANIYNRLENNVRNNNGFNYSSALQQARQSGGFQNNVYADKAGNVYRNLDGQWQSRSQGNWQQARDFKSYNYGNYRQQRQSSPRSRDYNLNRDMYARQRGQVRESIKLRGRRGR